MIDETGLPFLAEKGHVISLVGGGGKTTLLYAMAECCAQKGWRVLVTTTTHILRPAGDVWAQNESQLSALWQKGSYAVAGTPAPGGKLTAPTSEQLEKWMPLADIVLIEADGAKHLPCKAPAEHEPVLLPQSDILLAVAGLTALGQPLAKVCFRLEEACRLLHTVPDAILTPELLARLLASRQGGRKNAGNRAFYAVLNQADSPQLYLLGRQTKQILQQNYQVKCVITSFVEGERA